MTSVRTTLLALLFVLPCSAVVGQGKAPLPSKLTPEQRSAAQAKLNQQASDLYTGSLDPAKRQLRDAAVSMRDTLAAAAGTAALINRAQATKSTGVVLSQSRRLQAQCGAAQRRSVATTAAIASIKTSDAKGIKVLTEYRGTLTEIGRVTGECEKNLMALAAKPNPDLVRITAIGNQVSTLAERHTTSFEALMQAMEIRVRP